MKLTKRKGFNFFRSYFDVYNELESDADKVAFMDALLDRQFMGVKPKGLTGMAKFAYISQTNSIDSQVKGYEDKTKTKLNPLEVIPDTPKQGGVDTPTGQVEGKGEVEEKEKEKEEVEDEDTLHNINILKSHYLSKEQVLKAVISNSKNKVKDLVDLKLKLDLFCKDLIEQGRHSEKWSEFTRYFLNCLRNGKYNDGNYIKPIDNPNNEKIIRYNSNVNPTIFELPESKFLELQEKNKLGGYIYKIIN